MSKQSTFIAQITEEEEKAKTTLENIEKENNERIITATEQTNTVIKKAEETTKNKAQIKINEAKENAKDEYKKIIVTLNNERRDVIEVGNKNLSKAENSIHNYLVGLFE